jgi:nephrocystin-3
VTRCQAQQLQRGLKTNMGTKVDKEFTFKILICSSSDEMAQILKSVSPEMREDALMMFMLMRLDAADMESRIVKVATAYIKIGDYEFAKRILKHIEDYAKTRGKDKMLLQILGTTGMLYLETKQFNIAKEYAEVTIAKAKNLDDQYTIERCTINLGIIASENCDWGNAVKEFRKALEIATKIYDDRGADTCIKNIKLTMRRIVWNVVKAKAENEIFELAQTLIDAKQLEYVIATVLMEATREDQEPDNGTYQKYALMFFQRLGETLIHVNLFNEACLVYNLGTRIADHTENPKVKAEMRLNLANLTALTGKPEEAEKLLSTLIHFCESNGLHELAVYSLISWGGICENLNALSSARDHYEAAHRIAEANGLTELALEITKTLNRLSAIIAEKQGAPKSSSITFDQNQPSDGVSALESHDDLETEVQFRGVVSGQYPRKSFHVITLPQPPSKGDKSAEKESFHGANRPWRNVRVFVSSTFRDMYSERDYLAKVVFPELRERMKTKCLHLIDLDLRWGITEQEAEQGKTLKTILQEIDKSRPFFIGLLGERFGSLPDKILEETLQIFPWLENYKGYSYTSLEIVHGVLRNEELSKYSLFYFRDPQFISKIPSNRRADFEAEDAYSAKKLKNLKDAIRAANVKLTDGYFCTWDETNTRVMGLEDFGKKVVEDLWNAICQEYPVEFEETDPILVERLMHEAFVEERSSFHVGRILQSNQLTQLVQEARSNLIIITGASGSGKSAFLANWYRKYLKEHQDNHVLAYFIGASPNSTNHYRLLASMCREMKAKYNVSEELPNEDSKLPETFAKILRSVNRQLTPVSIAEGAAGKIKNSEAKQIVLLLDGLDQLLPLEGAHGLGWLLNTFPQNICLVASCLEGECLDALRQRGAREIELPPLTPEERRQIVSTMLASWGRKLSPEQESALLSRPETKNPLYLRITLEELRLFGSFEQLTQKINSFPNSITELFETVLKRLEDDFGRDFVSEAFALIGGSRHGLSEAELFDLLTKQESGRLPHAFWTRLEYGAKMYLTQRGELYGFFHRQLAEAVEKRYAYKSDIHLKLAEYFMHSPAERRVDEYPYQLRKAERWQTLASVLSDLEFFMNAWDYGREYEWIAYWQALKDCMRIDQYYSDALKRKIEKKGENEQVGFVANKIGILLSDMALYDLAVPFYERSLKILEAGSDPKSQNIAMALVNLGRHYNLSGKFKIALPVLQRALGIYENILEPDHPLLAQTLNHLAETYLHGYDKFEEALTVEKRALKIFETAYGPNNFQVAQTVNLMAIINGHLGRFDEALPLFQRALRIYENNLGLYNLFVGQLKSSLGDIYEVLGWSEKAIVSYGEALKTLEIAVGKEHPFVAETLFHMSNFYLNQGKDFEALPLCERALSIFERKMGPDHQDVGQCLNSLAVICYHQGKYEEATHFGRRALEIYEGTFGVNHRLTISVRNNLRAFEEKPR